jgi:hypothetical protein
VRIDPIELVRKLRITTAELEARAAPYKTPGAREVLALGLGWVALTDAESEALGLRVTPIGAPMFPRKRYCALGRSNGRVNELLRRRLQGLALQAYA